MNDGKPTEYTKDQYGHTYRFRPMTGSEIKKEFGFLASSVQGSMISECHPDCPSVWHKNNRK